VVVAIPLDLIPDFPTTPASWLTTEEQILAQERMMEDVCGIEDDPVKSARRSGLTEASTDWTVWWLAITTTFMNIMLSFQSFFPTLVATVGYGPIVSLLLCSPPWIIGVATSIWVMRFVLHDVFLFIDHLSTSQTLGCDWRTFLACDRPNIDGRHWVCYRRLVHEDWHSLLSLVSHPPEAFGCRFV